MNPSSNIPTDQELIDQTRAGNTAAFGGLIRRYQNRLFHSMVHVLRNQSDAEDVVQDAFVSAMTKLDSFQGNSQFYTWLFRIARNGAISKLRKKRPKVSLDALTSGTEEGNRKLELPDVEISPSAGIEQRERAESLMNALGKMSVEHREIIILREMDSLDYETIGEMLGIAAGTVRSRLHRARGQLKELLIEDGLE